jgi:hypothetical protein
MMDTALSDDEESLYGMSCAGSNAERVKRLPPDQMRPRRASQSLDLYPRDNLSESGVSGGVRTSESAAMQATLEGHESLHRSRMLFIYQPIHDVGDRALEPLPESSAESERRKETFRLVASL